MELAETTAAKKPNGSWISRGLAVTAMILGSMLFLIPTLMPPAAAEEIAVIYPPWWTASQVFAAVADGASIVRSTRLPFVVVVRSGAPDRFERLRRGGALLLINSSAKACGEEKI